MTERSKKYISDIRLALDLIEEFMVGIDRFTDYEQDRKTQSAVERQLVIIGEALNHFRRLEPSIFIESDKQIINFRNRLVHAYDGIDNSIVWAILQRHLTPLKEEIQRLSYQ